MRSLPSEDRGRSGTLRKPKLGQNFLVSPKAAGAIVDALGDLARGTVLEIGAGKGAITGLLAQRAKELIAVEMDRSLAAALQKNFSGRDGHSVAILCEDILALDLTQLASRLPSRFLVIGNLPYYITSPILLHLFAHSSVIEKAVLMVQSEVAERIVASPGTRDYGLLSATTQMYAAAETIFTLPPQAFVPAPSVHSTVVRLIMRPRFEPWGLEPQAFQNFLRQSFALKRKTLANNLRTRYRPAAIQSAYAQLAMDPRIRAEAVCLETMAQLFRLLAGEALVGADDPASPAQRPRRPAGAE